MLLGCATTDKAPARAAATPTGQSLADWPRLSSPVPRDATQEARIAQILAGMTLAQKVGQMTQPEIKAITPDEVRRYAIGSVLNGGGSRPGDDKRAPLTAWLALAEAYHAASMATDMAIPVPVLWGTDAVHGHNNVFGATLFPHNIGLGATRDAALVREIGAATARAVRASGIPWVFAPTLAVVRDDRWGRTYEGFSEDPAIVAQLGGAAITGLQGTLGSDASVLATAKHFIGDGGTALGRDQGINHATRAEMIALHGAGYYSALAAGVQTVMASFHSWQETTADGRPGTDHGKMHGSHHLLTEVLKGRLGFDGLVVSDWNGVGQVPGCTPASCAVAINAGIDLVMVPEQWREFIANTIAQVQRGEIPLSRIDDAVSRILRVKLRAGLFNQGPAQNAYAGRPEALLARSLARQAVRQSLVLLKNNRPLALTEPAGPPVLPLARSARILVVGKSADSLQNQTGGWTLSWQGTDNRNSDFPAGDTVLAGLRQALGAERVSFSETAEGVDARQFDAVVAVLGELPYAEGTGDIPPSGSLHHSSRHPEDLAVLQRVAGRGVPVVTVFLSGRPLHTNDLINLSDAFVAGWLPGTEGAGVADLLVRQEGNSGSFDFSGRLGFSWPRSACQTPLNAGDAGYAPLFALGHGLRYASHGNNLPQLENLRPSGACAAQSELPIFNQSAQPPYSLNVGSLDGSWPDADLGNDLNAVIEQPAGRPAVRVSTVQINTQQDARQVAWLGPARFFAWAAQRAALASFTDAALVFDVVVSQAPGAPVLLGMGCGSGCLGSLAGSAGPGGLRQVDLGPLLHRVPLQQRQTIKLPLACFAKAGLDLDRIEMPFSVATTAPFTAAFTAIRVVAGAARDADAQRCADLPPITP